MSDAYSVLLARKAVAAQPAGMVDVPDLHPDLFPHQRATTEFLLRTGRGAAFLDTGLGKSLVALEWARHVADATCRPVLMLAPLAVSTQHAREAGRFGIAAQVVRDQSGVDREAVNLTNYERLHLFDPERFGGVVLDESSIIKGFTGATTRKLMKAFGGTPYRLACTATPAPNDHMELGQHSQFLGVMPSHEMLSRWFIADQSEMGRYRLKRYGVRPFWSWVASWSRCVSKPSDLGFSDEGFVLPELQVIRHDVAVDQTEGAAEGELFRVVERSATSLHREKRLTAAARADKIAEIVSAEPHEPWLIWVDTDYEADAITARLRDAVEVRGSHPPERKEEALIGFATGAVTKLVTKTRIAGFGLNYQHCARMAFPGLSYSYEQYYQAIRRCWRFGQKRPVQVHVALAETERGTWHTVMGKAAEHEVMKAEMVAAMRRETVGASLRHAWAPTRRATLPPWMMERS